jgi:hypothetical protein
MSVCVCACARLCVCVHFRACALRACARVRACTRAFVSACACDCAFPSDCNFLCVCSDRVCVCLAAACAPPSHARRRLAVFIARPAPRVGVCARVVAVGETGGARACRPQVSRGRAARPRRNGLRELTTRPWSTPPAPSTSSAAATTATCGRAPTEVRGRTRFGGWVDGVLEGVLEWVLRGY